MSQKVGYPAVFCSRLLFSTFEKDGRLFCITKPSVKCLCWGAGEQVWANCREFNDEGDYYWNLGEEARMEFQCLWCAFVGLLPGCKLPTLCLDRSPANLWVSLNVSRLRDLPCITPEITRTRAGQVGLYRAEPHYSSLLGLALCLGLQITG